MAFKTGQEKIEAIEMLIGGNYSFEFRDVSKETNPETLISTSIKARIICEGMCCFIIRQYGVHMKHNGTMNDFISLISNLSDAHPELKNIISDLRVVQVKCNMSAHFQANGMANYRDVQIMMASLDKIEDWFIENYGDCRDDNICGDNAVVQDTYDDYAMYQSPYDIKKDFDETLAAAENGSVKAMYEVANMYFYGITSNKECPGRDVKKAAFWFRKLSEADSDDKDYDDYYKAYGMRYLGHMYYSGSIPFGAQSYEKCFNLHTEAVKLSATAIPHLAYMYSVGSGCRADIRMAEKLYESIAEKGDPNRIFDLASLYKANANYKRAGELYKMICDKFPSAAFELGMLYKKGLISGQGPDYFKANVYLDMAIKAGYSEAEAYLEKGKMYFNPTGDFSLDFEKAENCFLKSADLGNYEACYMLGYMYENGHVKSATKELAISYHKKAALHGIPSSAVSLAILLHQKGDLENAFSFAKLAYNMGSSEGSFVYGNMLMAGIGCEPDLYEAENAYDYALEHGYQQAGFMKERLIKCRPDIY